MGPVGCYETLVRNYHNSLHNCPEQHNSHLLHGASMKSCIVFLLYHIFTRHVMGLFWVPSHAGVRGNEITDRLASSGSGQRFIGPEPFLGVSRQNIRRKMKSWVDKQHLTLWHGPCGTQRQARELISGHWGPIIVLQ
jgi:hypothetical protein